VLGCGYKKGDWRPKKKEEPTWLPNKEEELTATAAGMFKMHGVNFVDFYCD
jgi:hypothetical protein